MKPGNALAFGGRPCVHLTPLDTDPEVVLNYAIDIGAMNYDDEEIEDGEGQRVIVRFPGHGSDESVTFAELAARLDPSLVKH